MNDNLYIHLLFAQNGHLQLEQVLPQVRAIEALLPTWRAGEIEEELEGDYNQMHFWLTGGNELLWLPRGSAPDFVLKMQARGWIVDEYADDPSRD